MRSPLHGRGAHRDRDRGRPSGRFRDESGSILVLFSIFLVMFLMCCAVVVDVGYWWVAGKRAQIAADACALAAAAELPAIPEWDPPRSECVIEGRDYAVENLPDQTGPDPEPRHVSTEVLSPYDGSTRMVQATVEMTVQTFFGRIVGLKSIDLTRRAVAEQQAGVNEVAVHGHDTSCSNDVILINGFDNEVNGILESNGWFKWNGDTFVSGPATAGGPNGCDIHVNGPNASFAGDPAPTRDPVPHPWPAYFVPWETGFQCDYYKRNFVFSIQNEVIPPGVYCAEESFEVNGQGATGDITVMSPLIKINAEKTKFAPSAKALAAGKPLLFFHIPNSTIGQDGDVAGQPDDLDPPSCEFAKEMILNARGVEWTGIIFNPCSRIVIDGDQNSVVQALIEAQTVRINGEKFAIDNLPFQGTTIQLALVE